MQNNPGFCLTPYSCIARLTNLYQVKFPVEEYQKEEHANQQKINKFEDHFKLVSNF